MDDAYSDRSSSLEIVEDSMMASLVLQQHNAEYQDPITTIDTWRSSTTYELEHDDDDDYDHDFFPSMFSTPYPIPETTYSTPSSTSSPPPVAPRLLFQIPVVPSHRKPKASIDKRPRCYEHGCNGRIFSTQGNYKRHMLEKRKSKCTTCPNCKQVFTRKSNCDKHIHDRRCLKRERRGDSLS